MHYYSFHIKDYHAATAHLSIEEDCCYRRLIDMYYETERPIPLETDWVSRRLRIGTEAVNLVLNDFFVRHEDGWHLPRCDEEIIKYHTKAEVAKTNGKLGGRPSKTQSVSDRNLRKTKSKANQEPITKNQEPIVNPTSLRDVPPLDSAKPKKSSGVTLSQWMAGVHERGEKLMSDYAPLNEYTEKVGLPADWVELAWIKFRDRYTSDEKASRKRYTNWRQVFKRAVEDNWMKLWFYSDADKQFRLTTVGVSADLATREAA